MASVATPLSAFAGHGPQFDWCPGYHECVDESGVSTSAGSPSMSAASPRMSSFDVETVGQEWSSPCASFASDAPKQLSADAPSFQSREPSNVLLEASLRGAAWQDWPNASFSGDTPKQLSADAPSFVSLAQAPPPDYPAPRFAERPPPRCMNPPPPPPPPVALAYQGPPPPMPGSLGSMPGSMPPIPHPSHGMAPMADDMHPMPHGMAPMRDDMCHMSDGMGSMPDDTRHMPHGMGSMANGIGPDTAYSSWGDSGADFHYDCGPVSMEPWSQMPGQQLAAAQPGSASWTDSRLSPGVRFVESMMASMESLDDGGRKFRSHLAAQLRAAMPDRYFE